VRLIPLQRQLAVDRFCCSGEATSPYATMRGARPFISCHFGQNAGVYNMRKLTLFLAGAMLIPTAAIAQSTPQSSDPSATSTQDHQKHKKDKKADEASADTTAPTPDSGTTGSGTTEPAPDTTAPATDPSASTTTPTTAPDAPAPTPQR
jgi:hypothetical protein